MAVTSLLDPGRFEEVHLLLCSNNQAKNQSETASTNRSQCKAEQAWWGFMPSFHQGVGVEVEMGE